MKKIINLLLAACLLVSMMGISALAADEYTGPATHTLPAYIDFENETSQLYYEAGKESKNFYYHAGSMYISGENENGNKYLLFSTSNADGQASIKFADFTYDSTVAVGSAQPTKLVISYDAKYTQISDAAQIGTYHHVNVGSTTTLANRTTYSIDQSPNQRAMSFYYKVNTTNKKIEDIRYSTTDFPTADFDSNAFLNDINGGKYIEHAIVIDLTKDANNKGKWKLYVGNTASSERDLFSADIEKINTLYVDLSKSNKMQMDNVRIYTVPNEAIQFVSSSVTGSNVSATTEEVAITFNHEIVSAADRYIKVLKDGSELTNGTDYTIEHVNSADGAKTAKSLKVKFAEPLSYETDYEIKAGASYFGMDGNAIGTETSLASFTTETYPQINLSELTVKKGFFGTTNITSLSEALGSTVCVTTTVANADARGAVNGTVFFGVYKNDNLVSLAYVKKAFSTAETDTISVNMKMPEATDADVVSVKAFVCEDMTNITPFGSTVQVSTAD